MRVLEITLFLADAVTLSMVGIPLLRASRWIVLVAAFLALIAGMQVLVEGPRWQLIPAYALTLVLLVIWLLGLVAPGHVHGGRFITGVGIGLGVLALAVSAGLSVVLPVFHFPKPTGPYAVGSVTYHWVDTSRPEIFTADPNDDRELLAQVWYPAREQPSGPRVPYIQDAGDVTSAMARLVHFPGFLFGHFKYVTTNAVSHALMADDKPSWPVLVFLTGLGGFRSSNTFQIEELVSHGYIVVGLDQPGASAAVRLPDGRVVSVPPRDEIQALIEQSINPGHEVRLLNGHRLENGIIPYFVQDVSFTIDRLVELNRNDPNDRLTGRLDLQHIGAFGISLGAIVAAEASEMDARIGAALMMDAAMPADVVRSGLRQPCMWITRPASDMRLERSRSGGWPEASITETLTTMRAVYDVHAPGSAYYVDAPGMFHVNFTDAPFWSPVTSLLGLTGPVDGKRMFDVVNAYSLAFFDRYLKGQPEPLLDGSSGYAEVRLEERPAS